MAPAVIGCGVIMLVHNRARLFDISHLSVGYACHRANYSRRPFELVPNIIGGIDVVEMTVTPIDEAEPIAAASPSQKALAAYVPDELSAPRSTKTGKNVHRLRFDLWQKRMCITESLFI